MSVPSGKNIKQCVQTIINTRNRGNPYIYRQKDAYVVTNEESNGNIIKFTMMFRKITSKGIVLVMSSHMGHIACMAYSSLYSMDQIDIAEP